MTDLAQAFAELARSTAAFHERFETRKHSDMKSALMIMNEEYLEADLEGLYILCGHHDHKGELANELVDLLMTMLGVALHAGISEADLAAAMLEVADKNDKKTLQNCTWHEGKVTRNEKLPKGGA